ncbi:pentapeptide repeat-containing protein [Nodosilinea sp. LEGE 07088]|uniref:serine/threonine-protein kinase n=1 Tax=Nodosilinea sp. LEGE 07088 TaxID=2777968 RepID=UPI00187F8533|nr:serine/threonine-protein kinase [Nodosilinea sp. LEGE 07088]MBE9138940.1 pentapeptide repeat-containing protein [Nodosilinea sp. LEGE 07088]
MSYCINPDCSKPKNAPTVTHCQCCGAELLLRGRYRMIRALGRGGFGATFLARDEQLPGKPPCVIKQLRPSAEAPHILDMARDLFKREAKILGMIGNHPQLPRLLDYFESEHEFYLVQEYINGLTLQQEVKRGGPFTEAGVKQFLCEILSMVQYVHNNQVIHRDIKPANIIRRDQDKKLVLIDFGAVKDKVNPLQAANSDQTALTAYAIGTPGYAPPEQMAMRPVYASDIYALGVTCVYLLSGKAPKDLSYDPNTGELLWLEAVHISDHFAGVLQKMLEISVKHRYQTVEAIHRDLDLEPYMDSLAQNMAYPTAAGGSTSGNTNGSGPASVAGAYAGSSQAGISHSGGSPSSRMAAAIRARRERSNSGGKAAPLVPSHSGSPKPLSRATSAKALSADDVKQKYTKGRRDFSLQGFKELDLQRTMLAEINFNQSQLPSANFQGSDLSNANFGRANLSHASLRNANLVKAYFHYANLEGADLRGANLARASLSNANLRGANLCGADLTGALISSDQLAVARTNWSTVMPNGRRNGL